MFVSVRIISKQGRGVMAGGRFEWNLASVTDYLSVWPSPVVQETITGGGLSVNGVGAEGGAEFPIIERHCNRDPLQVLTHYPGTKNTRRCKLAAMEARTTRAVTAEEHLMNDTPRTSLSQVRGWAPSHSFNCQCPTRVHIAEMLHSN